MYPRPFAPGQESEGSRVENGFCLERAVDYSNKDLEDAARLIHLYLGILFGISLLRKQVLPYLRRGSLAYIFSGLLLWMQISKECSLRKCVLAQKLLYYRGKI